MPKNYKLYTKGAIFDIKLFNNQRRKGEIITVDSSEILLLELKSNLLSRIDIRWIKNGELQISRASNMLSQNNSSQNIIPLLTISHGFLGIITLPINLAVTVPLTTDYYAIKYPRHISWSHLHKFSRFPQGMTDKILLDKIK